MSSDIVYNGLHTGRVLLGQLMTGTWHLVIHSISVTTDEAGTMTPEKDTGHTVFCIGRHFFRKLVSI